MKGEKMKTHKCLLVTRKISIYIDVKLDVGEYITVNDELGCVNNALYEFYDKNSYCYIVDLVPSYLIDVTIRDKNLDLSTIKSFKE